MLLVSLDMLSSLQHASAIIPGGMRSALSTNGMHACTYAMQATATRMESLIAYVAIHRTWGARLSGIGVLLDTQALCHLGPILWLSTLNRYIL